MVANKQDVAIQESGGIVGMMERLAANPDIPVDKLRELLEMQKEILDREADQLFSEAMMAVQAELPTVVKDKLNEQTRSMYAKYDTICRAIKPVYTKHGFSISFSEETSPKPDHIRVIGIVRHRGGHKEVRHVDVAIDIAGIKGNANKTMTHAEASSDLYGRRRLTCMVFDVAVGDDDDGNAAGGSVETITAEQVAHLEKLIKEAKADRAQFLKTLEIEHLVDLPAKSFRMACVALKAKASTPAREPGSDDDK